MPDQSCDVLAKPLAFTHKLKTIKLNRIKINYLLSFKQLRENDSILRNIHTCLWKQFRLKKIRISQIILKRKCNASTVLSGRFYID